MQIAHQPTPDAQRAGSAVESDRLVVVTSDPDHGHAIGAEAGKPGIAGVVGGAGFAGEALAGRQHRNRPARRAEFDDLLHRPGRQVHRAFGQCLLELEAVAR